MPNCLLQDSRSEISIGYWKIIGAIIWTYIIGFGALYLTPVYGWPGFTGWLALNLLLAYRWNQARKSRGDIYDDHLTEDRMQSAKEELIRSWEKENEER